MKRSSLLIAGLCLFFTWAVAQERQVDVKLSKITWTGKKVTGEHMGNIQFKSGTLQMKDKELVGGKFVVDMTTITCTDLDNKDYNAKLVGHLKSDDFFGVEKYTESRLIISKVVKEDSAYKVIADLTIKGKTHPVAFNVTKSGNAFEGKIIVDRTQYDVKYGSGKFFDNLGDKMIYDDFELAFKVFAME
ncbi:YceI family protein [Carboxylicivirga sediminis]|uniref:YceI family protein n=1 Tax=Carboxylicivirga sediminis TaxID=2006564 RepID=A0A941F4E2_9BACT|nr:YceI family protein [Carboxylicivirga sediminis]MBR8535010.1 YceI family protein [Carboxylicivirga sediminis]